MSKQSQPIVSVNKLAEYVSANAIRRRQIVKSIKDDNEFIKTRYESVRKVLPKFFKANYDATLLDDAITLLNTELADVDNTKWDMDDLRNSILAFNNLRRGAFPDLDNYDFIKPESKLDFIELSGVKVIVKPELYLQNKKTEKVGGIKFSIAKTPSNQLDATRREYVATVIKYGLICSGYPEKSIENNACLSYDVFQKDFSFSPRAFKRNIGQLEACCEEIALKWDTL